MRVSFHLHAIHDVCLSVVGPRSVLLLFLYVVYLFSSTLCLHSDLHSFFHVDSAKGPSPNDEYFTLAIYHPPTGYEPNAFDDFHYLATSEMIFQKESGDIDTEPSYLCDAELDDETIGKALYSPLFIQEREEPANRRQAYHSLEESLLPVQSFFAHTGTGIPVCELSSHQKRKSSREMENERIRILRERQKEQILAEVRTEIQKHEFQADADRSIQVLNGIIESQRREIDHTVAGDEQLRRDQILLHEQLSEQNRDLREVHMKKSS